MKTTAVILFAGIAAAQRDQVMRKDFNQDRFMPEMMGGD